MAESLNSDQAFIRKLTEIVLTNLQNEKFGVGNLAKEAGLSRITIHRRLKYVKNQNASQFIREIRLRRAMELLQQNAGSVSEIAYMVGFGSPGYFNKCFHRFFGCPPSKIRKEVIRKVEDPTLDQVIKFHSVRSAPRLYFVILSSVILFFTVLSYVGYIILNKNSSTVDSNAINISEKSIAVMPFINDSPSDSTTYFINGVMDEVLNNLQRISAFSKVISRTSTEQYRGSRKVSLPKIAKALNVNYIVEGSGQKHGKIFRLSVRLFEAKKDILIWSKSYEEKIQEIEDITRIQNQVAQSIASALEATVTLETKQLIEKLPTLNLTAYDFYQRGKEEEGKYALKKSSDRQSLERAEKMFKTALKYDARYARAYTGLAKVYWDKHFWEEYFLNSFPDSILYFCDIALSIDPQLSEAYTLKGVYYSEMGNFEKSLVEFDNALKLNPNDWMALRGKGEYYRDADFINYFYYLQRAISINHGPELPDLLREIGELFFATGFPAKSNQYYQEALKLDSDSAKYYCVLAIEEFWLENFDKSIELGLKGYAIDSTNNQILEYLGAAYQWLGHNKESLNYYEKWLNGIKLVGYAAMYGMRRIGYAYWQSGFKKEAEYYFTEQINNSNRLIELNRPWRQNYLTYSDLAGVYAFRGEKEKAFKNLRIYNQTQKVQFLNLMILKTDPLFNRIRNEPEFQQIVKDFEAKYMAEHLRVKKWLEEQGML